MDDKLTPISIEDCARSMGRAWTKWFGTAPEKRESIALLVAHWALETGWGKSMHNFNFGNIKSRDGDGYEYQFFRCNEILPTALAMRIQAASPAVAKITKMNDKLAIIWFDPDHPACRFRAYRNADEGCMDYFRLLVIRFARAWPGVVDGDPYKFGHALKTMGYYTADEKEYVTGLAGCMTRALKANWGLPYNGEIEQDMWKKDHEAHMNNAMWDWMNSLPGHSRLNKVPTDE